MEEERPVPGTAPFGAAAGPGPLPKPTKLGLPGAGSEAEALAAEHGAGSYVLLRPLYHHPSNSANVKMASGGAGGGGIPGSPMALKSLPSPLRRTLRSYPSAAAILEGPGGPPGGAGADIFSRGRDALLLQQQQRQQRRHQQQRGAHQAGGEEERPGSLPASPSRPGSGTNSPPVVVAGMTMAHPTAAAASPVLATALGPRLSRHAPLPSFSPRQGPKTPASPAAPNDAGARLSLPMPSPLPALAPVATSRPATPPSKLLAARPAPSGSGSSPQQPPSSGRPPSPLQRSKTMPPSRPSSASVPSSPMPPMLRTQSTSGGGRRRSDSLPSSPTATPVVVTSGAATAETVPVVRTATGGGASKEKVKKKVAFEQQPAAPPPPPPHSRSRSGSVSSVASSASEGDGTEPAPVNHRFARQQAPNAQGANKLAACDLSRLPAERRARLLGMLRRLGSDLQEEEEEGSQAPAVVPEEVAALQRRIHDAGRPPAASQQESESSGPCSPLLLGPAALRTQVQRDFGVKPTRGEAAALARFLARRTDGGVQGLGEGAGEPVLDYVCVQRFLLQPPPPPPMCEEEEPVSPPVMLLKRRSILQEEAAKSELAFVPRDAASRALLEKMGEAASCLDRHQCDARVRQRGDGATATVPAKVSIEELDTLARDGLGLRLEAAELKLVVRWFGNHGEGGGGGGGLSLDGEAEEGEEQQQQQQQQEGPSLVDYALFLQHFWALGAAAKRIRRKEEAQARFLRVLATVGTGAGDEGAASG